MWKRRGAATSSRVSAANLGLGALKNISKPSKCTSISTRPRSVGTRNQDAGRFMTAGIKEQENDHDSDSLRNSRTAFACAYGAAKRGGFPESVSSYARPC